MSSNATDHSGPDASGTSPAIPLPYSGEVRFGVVMYGGVSLAIYINGVANELYELCRATPKAGPGAQGSAASGTVAVYRLLSALVANGPLRASLANDARSKEQAGEGLTPDEFYDRIAASVPPDAERVRFVVDVVSGTSAGGINGIFLAKALANGEPFLPLKDLWISEGDIGLLLNDRKSYAGLDIRDSSATPGSLLNSDRMYLKLLDAMNEMSKGTVPGESPFVDELDLFVTATDIIGARVPLRLFDKVVYERRYRQVYRFNYPGATGNANAHDFVPENNEFLAFAARCTSSFPFAFEPMTLEAVKRLRPEARKFSDWERFFPDLPPQIVRSGAHASRPFGDGGYLDNKPFSYAVRTLSSRQGTVPVERKLVYVEPSPEQLGPDPGTKPGETPDAITNSLAALTSIPRYQTIREDLQAVLQRNRRIERVDRIVRLGEADLEQPGQDFFRGVVVSTQGRIPNWNELKLSDLQRFYGSGFVPYRRLRVYAVTDDLAFRLAPHWQVDASSDRLYALRALVRVWREARFDDEAPAGGPKQTVNAFLDSFDLRYRIRRLEFLIRKVDQITRLLRKNLSAPGELEALSESDRRIAARLKDEGLDPRDATPDQRQKALAALQRLKAGMYATHKRLRLADQRQFKADPPSEDLLRELGEVLDLLLGTRPDDAPALTLVTGSGSRIPVSLPEKLYRTASATRTLQETVYERAEDLVRLTAGAERTVLLQVFESTLKALGAELRRTIKGDALTDDASLPASDESAAAVWRILGRPKLTPTGDEDHPVAVVVSATGEPLLDDPEGVRLRRFLGAYYLRFDAFDQMSFPLYYDTGTGEPATVEVIRISPEDAPSLIDETDPNERRRKLAGTALSHFGAFLDQRFRRNDIMWGRLDGAERLIGALLPSREDAAIRKALIAQAHKAILQEELAEHGHTHLTETLCAALASPDRMEQSSQLKAAISALKLGDTAARDRIEVLVNSLMTAEALQTFVRDSRDIDRTPDPKASLDNAARAITVTGRVLNRIVEKSGRKSGFLRWIARAGLGAQALVAVAVPGSLASRWWSHGLKVLYAFELFVLAISILAGAAETRTVALTALGVTAALHVASLVAGDFMRERNGVVKAIAWLGIVAVLVLAGIGVHTLLGLL